MIKRLQRILTVRLWILRNLIFNHANLSIPTRRVHRPKSTVVLGRVKIICHRDADIDLGENVTLNSKSSGYHGGMPFGTTLFADTPGAMIRIGDNSRLNGVYIHAKKQILIGKNCVFAAGTCIVDSNGHRLISGDRTTGTDDPKDIVIGDNVWLCMNSIVLKGTIIGDNCVIGANSVVKGTFPNNCLIQGNPAQITSILNI